MRRFKTEEEYLLEFGKNWKDVIPGGWSSGMNSFIGQNMDDVRYERYAISPAMVTTLCVEDSLKNIKEENKFKSLLTFTTGGGESVNITFKSQTGYTAQCTFYISPTGNCQMACVSCFNNILKYCSKEEAL